MKRRLICADFPELEAHFAENVRSLRERDALAPLIVLVPSNLLRVHLKRALVHRGVNHVNIRFVTFRDLVEDATKGCGFRQTPQFAEELLIRSACRQAYSSTGTLYFSGLYNHAGLHRALWSSVLDLKQAGFTPAAFNKIVLGAQWEDSTQSKLVSLAQIWEEYESLKSQANLIDEADAMSLAATSLHNGSLLDQSTALIVYGIYDFNELQHRLLRSCAEQKDVTVYFPFEDSPSFEYVRSSLKHLQSGGFRCIQLPRSRSVRSDVLQHLCDRMFCDPDDSKLNDEIVSESIHVLSAPGDSREAREILRELIRLVGSHRETDRPRIGIVLRNTGQRFLLFRDVCQSAGIEPYDHEGQPLTATSAGRSFMLLLGIVANNYSRRAVMEFLTSTDLAAGESPPPVMLWDALTMRAGIVDGIDEWPVRLSRLRRDLERDSMRYRDEDDKIEPDIVGPLEKFLRALFAMLRGLETATSWSNLIQRAVATALQYIAKSDELSLVIEAIMKLAELECIGLTPDRDLFIRLCAEVLGSESSPSGRFERNDPLIASLMQARGVPFDIVALPGMMEKSFPHLPAQDPILLDSERIAINAATSTLGMDMRMPVKASRLDEERLLFRLAVGAAKSHVVLSFPRIDSDTSRERIPSHFLLSVMEAMTGRRSSFAEFDGWPCLRRIPISRPGPERPGEAIDTIEYDLASAAAFVTDSTNESMKRILAFKQWPHFARAIIAEQERWGRREFTKWDGMIEDPSTLRLLERHLRFDQPLSPGKLETYANCPFQFFLKHVLGLKVLTDPQTQVDTDRRERGLLLHELLAEFFRQEKEGGGLPVDKDSDDRLRDLANEFMDKFEGSNATGLHVMWQLQREVVLEELRHFMNSEIGWEAHYVPEWFEMRFGSGDNPPAELQICDGRTVQFRGRIDRVDLSRNDSRAWITDYKSGRCPRLDKPMFGYGEALQAAVYAYAVARRLQKPIAGARYLTLKIGEKSRSISMEDWAETLRSLRHVVRTLIDNAERGRFFQRPKNCKICDVRSVCMSTQEELFALKRDDPDAADFLEFKHELEDVENNADEQNDR